MTNTLLALAMGGTATTTVVAMLAGAAGGGEAAGGLAPYVGGGAGVVAVGALAEVTRRLLNGRLIPRETKDIEEELGAAIVAAGQREATLIATVEAMRRVCEDVRDEMRQIRRTVEGR